MPYLQKCFVPATLFFWKELWIKIPLPLIPPSLFNYLVMLKQIHLFSQEFWMWQYFWYDPFTKYEEVELSLVSTHYSYFLYFIFSKILVFIQYLCQSRLDTINKIKKIHRVHLYLVIYKKVLRQFSLLAYKYNNCLLIFCSIMSYWS